MFSFQTKTSILRALLTKRSPYYIQYYITGRCNLMCRQCNIVETNSRVPEMGLSEIRKTAQNLKRIGAGIVLLTGGEPFIREDLPQIVEIFTKLGLNVRLQTAGTKFATVEKLQACYDAGARDINVSLDSLDFDKFDYINAVPGSAKNAIETIERISKVFRKKSAVLSFGTVFSRFNYKEVPAIVEFAQRIGWLVSIVPVHITHPALPKGFRSYDSDFLFSEQDHDLLNDLSIDLINLKRAGAPIFDSENFLTSSMSFLKGMGPTWRKNGICDSPNLYFAIRPDGAFTTCCDYVLSDPPFVYDDSFVDLYKNRTIENRQDVQDIIRSCSGCHYGSYPEVTISVRDFDAFLERTRMVLVSGKNRLIDAQVQTNFLDEVEKIKRSLPDIYPVESWMSASILKKVREWKDNELRKQIIKNDQHLRKTQNRIRGAGPDVPILAEQQGLSV